MTDASSAPSILSPSHQPFCRLFESDKYGQILVQLVQSEEEGLEAGPELRVSIRPPDLWVCSISFKWPNTDEGVDSAESFLGRVDQSLAESVARQILDSITELSRQEV